MLTTTCVTCRHPLPELCTCTGTHTAPPIYPCPGAFRLPIPKARLPSFSDTCPCSPDSHSLATPSPGRETPGAPAQEGAQLARGRHWILRGLHVRSAPSPFKHCTSAPRPQRAGGRPAATPCHPTSFCMWLSPQPGQPRAREGLPRYLPTGSTPITTSVQVSGSPQKVCGALRGRPGSLQLSSPRAPRSSAKKEQPPCPPLSPPSHRLDFCPAQLGEGGTGVTV